MNIKNWVPRLRSWRILATITATVGVCIALLAVQVKAELGGVLYRGGNYLGDSLGQPKITFTKDLVNSVGRQVISSQPHALWLGNFAGTGQDGQAAESYIYGALYRNEVPVLVLYNIPSRDCGQASSGSSNASNYEEYANWIQEVAGGIARAVNRVNKVSNGKALASVPILVMLEPDSIGLIPTDDYDNPTNGKKCWLSSPAGSRYRMFNPKERFAAISDAVVTLSSAGFNAPVCAFTTNSSNQSFRPYSCPSYNSKVKVYLDGGNSGWQSGWPDEMVSRMFQAGLVNAAGFFTNSSNYQTTTVEINYGYILSNIINGSDKLKNAAVCFGGAVCDVPPKTQIIDVSRNGNGPAGIAGTTSDGSPYQINGWPYWCDNRQALIGQHPTLNANVYVTALAPLSVFLESGGLFGGSVKFVDGLLWLKPPGETDGCWGGPSTPNNTQPDFKNPDPAKTMYLDELIGNVYPKLSTVYQDSQAGWPSNHLACGLVTGTFVHPYWDGASPSICDTNPKARLASPGNVRITRTTTKPSFDDTVTLEWEPVAGACSYHVGIYHNQGAIESIVQGAFYMRGVKSGQISNVVSDTGNLGPQTTFTVNPAPHVTDLVNYVKVNGPGIYAFDNVRYMVRAYSCDGKRVSYWSGSAKAWTSAFP